MVISLAVIVEFWKLGSSTSPECTTGPTPTKRLVFKENNMEHI